MDEFKKGDRVELVTPDEYDKELRNLLGGERGYVQYVDGAGWTYVEMDSGATYCFTPSQLEHAGAERKIIDSAKSETKLRESFYLFAMELVRNGDDVEDAIDTARKLQEASE